MSTPFATLVVGPLLLLAAFVVGCSAPPAGTHDVSLACLQVGFDGRPLRCLERPSARVCEPSTKPVDACPKLPPVSICDQPAGRLLVYQARDYIAGECEEAGGTIDASTP